MSQELSTSLFKNCHLLHEIEKYKNQVTMSKSLSLKSLVLLVFGIDTLIISIAIVRAILLERNPMRYFDDSGFVSVFSIGQLLFIAYLCWRISILRSQQNSQLTGWKNPSRFWQVMTAGFIFLTLDEGLQIHENLDKSLHKLLNLNPDGVTDILDDLIILMYVIIGLLFLWIFKKEFQKFISALRWFVLGFSLSFLTVALDILSQKRETLSPFIENPDILVTINIWMPVLEEVAKIFAEGAFVISFCSCLIITKKLKSQA